MGFLRDNFGKISVESRSESFYIHAGYGYSIGKHPVESLDFTTDFILNGKVYRARSKHPEFVAAAEAQFSTIKEIPNGTLVEVPGTEDFDPEAPLARFWSEVPHPEFAIEDLDDLIAALEDYRKALSI